MDLKKMRARLKQELGPTDYRRFVREQKSEREEQIDTALENWPTPKARRDRLLRNVGLIEVGHQIPHLTDCTKKVLLCLVKGEPIPERVRTIVRDALRDSGDETKILFDLVAADIRLGNI